MKWAARMLSAHARFDHVFFATGRTRQHSNARNCFFPSADTFRHQNLHDVAALRA